MTDRASEDPLPPPPLPPAPPPPGPPTWQPAAPVPTDAGWATPPTEHKPASRRRWVIGCGLLLVLLVIGVGACTLILARSFGAAGAVIAASHGEIDGFNARTLNGRTTTTFQAARGVDASEGPRLACDVIRPTLATTDEAGAGWVLVNRAGDVIASDETPCP